MPLSQIEICNSALIKVGGSTIISMSDDSKEARACSVRYDPCRRIVLRMHPWNCAITRVILSQSTTPGVWGPANVFPLPKDSLRILAVGDDAPYRVEGRNIITSEAQIKLKYVSDLQDTTQMDELLGEAIACYLAWDICFRLTGSAQARDVAWKSYELIKRQAKSVDSQEERDHVMEANLFTDSRINRASSVYDSDNQGEQ